MTDLNPGGAGVAGSSVANAINDSGQIVGNTTVVNASGLASQQAFLDVNGVMTALGTPYGTEESDANAISSSGQIVGNAGDPSNADGLGQHAILWSNGTATDLGTLPGDSFADATSINDSGVIVGDSYTDSSKSQIGHAFVYENGVMTDLNSLLPANSGYVLNTATEIDNADEICGMASYEGHIHGYVLYLSGSTTPPGTLASTIVVQSSGPTSLYGQTINLNAVVTASTPGSGTPTGSVTFLDGSTTLGTVVLQDDQATLSITNLMVGPHSITGIYSGDSQFTASTSAVVGTSVEQDATSLNLISSANAADAGQPVTFTATVSPDAPGSGTPTGTVTFEDGMTALGSASLSGGKAIFTTSGLAPGSHSISVQYGGNGDFLASDSAAFTLTVIASSFPTQPVPTQSAPTQSAPTQSALTASARSSTHGKPVTLTDTVKLRGAARGTPTGTVMFMIGGKVLRIVALNRGKAVFKTASLPVGSDRIQAVYAGDGSFGPSTSGILVERIVAARPRKARDHRARALKAAARSLAPAGPLRESRSPDSSRSLRSAIPLFSYSWQTNANHPGTARLRSLVRPRGCRSWHVHLPQWPFADEHRSNLIRVVWGEGVDPKLPSPPVLQLERVDASRHHVLLRFDQKVARPIRGYVSLRRIVVDVDVCGIETELVPLEELSPEVMHLRSPHKLISGLTST